MNHFMNASIVRRWVVVAVLLCFVGTAWAQVGASPPISGPPVGRAIGLNPQIESILKRMLDVYRQADSYRDAGRVSVAQTQGRIRQITEMPSEIAFQRPNRLGVVSGAQSITSDGQTLQIVLDNLGQYTSTPAPQRLTMEHIQLGAPGGGLDEGYPELLEFLLGDDVYQRWIQRIAKIRIADQEQSIESHACHVIHYESVYRAKVVMYIDVKTLLLLRCDIDATPSLAAGPASAPPDQLIEVRVDMFPAEVNGEVLGSSFEVVPPKGLQRVERFRNQPLPIDDQNDPQPPPDDAALPKDIDGRSPREQPGHNLVGERMPPIHGVDLKGRQITPKDFKNKVTLLFLWSPQGSPDSLAAVHRVQRVVDGFRDEPSFWALSISAKSEQPNLIEGLLRAKKATYPTLVDADGLVMQAFNVQVLPMFFVVSEDGIVRDVHSGLSPDFEDALARQIRGILERQ